jgi:hypothetical protein
MVNEPSPSMVNVVLELPFVNMVVHFTAYALHSSIGINLSISTLEVIPITSQGKITCSVAVSLDISGVEYS